ncbi:hypothetical protein JX265_010028 [Neoarthrinium moseri]|uniref:N-acetyltransferase domain-containing protein n=1 Tax=Neoarthrinium moseri TaxID=1658444 RepID=A0A9P9WET0_9PEZI|nr:uncharacterized protein JN550_012056 [Neoarthrinium moseri]KAI1844477.1 hypothetical protein JX266_009364 [Neoarthrinium moseri]KAI1859538.1 hypothetical protein JN550_012056 [Neoarthrinium moseri]KAI1860104.1 hypothetical protein JX265_010028 [Neoarthrinium moseri]
MEETKHSKSYPVVLPALIPDIKSVYDVYFASFLNEKMARIMVDIIFPGGIMDAEDFRKNHTAGTLAYWHSADSQYTFKCVDNHSGDVMGMALGDIILRERTPEERQFTGIPWLEGKDRERAEKVIGPLAEMRERLFGGARHIYVHVIAVHPSYQRRGAARALIEWGIDLCDRSNLPIYLESSPTTMPLYKKMGFVTLKEKIVHKKEVLGTDEDIEVPLMVRMPSYANMTFDQWRERGYPDFEKPGLSTGSGSHIPVLGGLISRVVKMLTGLIHS